MRSVALIVLFLFSILVAGPALASAVTPSDAVEKSCCSGCAKEEEAPSPSPCSTADCPLLLCIAADFVEHPVPYNLVRETVSDFIFIPKPIPDPYIPSIFHPPTAA